MWLAWDAESCLIPLASPAHAASLRPHSPASPAILGRCSQRLHTSSPTVTGVRCAGQGLCPQRRLAAGN